MAAEKSLSITSEEIAAQVALVDALEARMKKLSIGCITEERNAVVMGELSGAQPASMEEELIAQILPVVDAKTSGIEEETTIHQGPVQQGAIVEPSTAMDEELPPLPLVPPGRVPIPAAPVNPAPRQQS